MTDESADFPGRAVAIVGMACRVPDAGDLDEYWRLIHQGREAITFFSREDLIAAGVAQSLLDDPRYVPARGFLSGIDLFDAAFFGVSPREAELTDPQQRVFLECAWTALEHAGYDSEHFSGRIGVYAGAGWNSYLLLNLASDPRLLHSEAGHQVLLGNEKDNLTTRVSYKLNLKGPSLAVQTACSTSLVATALACQGLLNYQCDMALAGGVSIAVPQTGYLQQVGGILSPDGHCRPFDARAQGTVLGGGAGIVVLKRLEEALAEGDTIHAVIRGAAINNDGATKVGYTAPSVDGQTEVIVEAQALAGIAAETIGYVEAHGTATALGDPVEVTALTRAFRAGTAAKAFCALGSVKANIGHLDAAAGVAGLIKATLALENRIIPPSPYFENPNPALSLAESPFYIPTAPLDWMSNGLPRRAAVSSFGLGGTNAHVILEEGPVQSPSVPCRAPNPQLLIVSARSAAALEQATARLSDHLDRNPKMDLDDVAYTLSVGRKSFEHRRMVVAETSAEAAQLLREPSAPRTLTRKSPRNIRPIAFMFSGQGTQYAGMARNLYRSIPAFRSVVNELAPIFARREVELTQLMSDDDSTTAAEWLNDTENAQPALFLIEYALARLWISWGIPMAAAIGHSLGEIVAATLAGVFTLDDAAELVIMRGRLMQQVSPGSMLAVRLPADAVLPMLGREIDLAAVNEPASCVVSGPEPAVEELRARLCGEGIACRMLETSRAFHSAMMMPVLAPIAERVAGMRLRAPAVPFISNISGDWITDAEATDPQYWARHVREPVRFADGLRTLRSATDAVLLEIGPGRTLAGIAKRQTAFASSSADVLSSLRGSGDPITDRAHLLNTLGRLWLSGIRPDWTAVAGEPRRRLPLPTYPFEWQRYWLEPQAASAASQNTSVWQTAVGRAREAAVADAEGIDPAALSAAKAALQNLSLGHIVRAVRALGVLPAPGEVFSSQMLAERCVPQHRQLLQRWLALLAQRGLTAQARTDGPQPAASRLEASSSSSTANLAAWPATADTVALVERCGGALAEILGGRQQPIELFASKLDPASKIDPLDRHFCRILTATLAGILAVRAPTTMLRVLEIGGGTGIVTRELLPMLPAAHTRYTFTDIAPLFLSQASQKFTQFPFLDFAVLDIDNAPEAQGFPRHGFDLVIAANVMHVTRNVSRTLAHTRSLLASGGMLLAWEITDSSFDFEMTYGLLMKPLDDGARDQGNPFLSAEEWRARLAAEGFARVEILPNHDRFGRHVLIAEAAAPVVSGALPNSPAGEAVPAALKKNADIADWFYLPSWRRADCSVPAEMRPESWLAFADCEGSGATLVEQLEALGMNVAIVEAGPIFRRSGERRYVINPENPADYRAVLEQLAEQKFLPTQILHAWSLPPRPHTTDSDSFTEIRRKGFDSLLFLAQAVGECRITRSMQISVITDQAHDVIGTEVGRPETALILGPCRVIPLEYPNLRCRNLDVAVGPQGADVSWVKSILTELTQASTDPIVAFRGGHRWLPGVEQVRLKAAVAPPPVLRRGGVYLITGGLGTIGLEIAEYLASTVQARLILVGRSTFPPPEKWDSLTDAREARVARRLSSMRSMGADIMVVSADVSDLSRMRAVHAEAERRFGPINGVVHSAGVLGDGAIQNKSIGDVEHVLSAKVRGTLVLKQLFESVELDFWVLFSSLSARRPTFGQAAYSAANNFLDALASKPSNRHRAACCISWDVWHRDGMAYDAQAPLVLRSIRTADFDRRGISPVEGVEVFRRILNSGLRHVLVSTSNYLAAAPTDDRGLPTIYLDSLTAKARSELRHGRPALESSYVAAGSETETMLVRMWEELLGIDGIGIDDNFFSLGGDSLIGTQLTTRIKADFAVKLPIRAVYDDPTIRRMAVAVELALINEAAPARLSGLLHQLG